MNDFFLSFFTVDQAYWLPIYGTAAFVATITGLMGCLVLWNRQSFLGETLAHGSIGGVALSLLWHIPPLLGMVFVGGIIMKLLATKTHRPPLLTQDTILAIVAQGGLGLGLLILMALPQGQIDLHSMLYGDILAVSWSDSVGLLVLCLLIVGVVMTRFHQILATVIHRDLALVEKKASPHMPKMILGGLVFSTAFLLPVVGALLLTSLLVLPAATARYLCTSPRSMMIGSLVVSHGMVWVGMALSKMFDWPTSPTITMVGLSFLLCGHLSHGLRYAGGRGHP